MHDLHALNIWRGLDDLPSVGWQNPTDEFSYFCGLMKIQNRIKPRR